MKINFCLKLALAVFFAITQSFADGVTTIATEYGHRRDTFNAMPLAAETYAPHTANINAILKEKSNVDENRPASDDEKATILKAVMASVIIHGDDATYKLPTHGLKEGDSLYGHFEILRLTEKLAGDLLGQLTGFGAIDMNSLTGYKNLYGFSGQDEDAFGNWFLDVFAQHNPGFVIQNPSISTQKTDRIYENLKLLKPQKVHGLNEMVEFGTIRKESITNQSVVFVSTYNLNKYQIISNGLFVHLPAKEGRERYIVIENPYFDDAIDDSKSPYTIRAHALINGSAQPRDVNVSVKIVSGENESIIIGMDERGLSVNSHDRTFSPNNKWLTNLPERPLQTGETFSFVSRIDGDGKMIDTLHILAYDTISVVTLARSSSNFDDFLKKLNDRPKKLGNYIFGDSTLLHLGKMMAFIEERI